MSRILCWLLGHCWRGRFFDSQTGYHVTCYRCGKDHAFHYPSEYP